LTASAWHPASRRGPRLRAIVVALMASPAITGTIVDVDGGEFLGHIGDR
jgi:hypothetical protein